VNINFSEVIKALKEITGPRFYFIVSLCFLAGLIYIFREPLTVTIQEISFERVEFREVRDLKGLEISLETLKDKKHYSNYTVYIYQPKYKSFYKRIILTDSDIVKAVSRLQGSYLDDQPTINNALSKGMYILLDYEDPKPDTQYLHDIGFKYLFIYKLGSAKNPIGEIHIGLSTKPTQKDISSLITDLGPLLHMYII